MSAQNKQLQWIELTDFSPGLSTVGGDLLEPATAASQMDDCMVSPFGGFHAAMRAISHPITGIANSGSVFVKGLLIYGGIGVSGLEADRFLWLQDGTDLKVYRWDDGLPATSWLLIATIALSSGVVNSVVADTFVDSAADEYIMFNVFQSGGSDGVWSIKRSDGSVTRRVTFACTSVVVQDNIIIAANGHILRWSAAQSVSSWPTENNLPVGSSRRGSTITVMNAFAPSDLILGMDYAPWIVVQGDITQPLVRSMSDARIPQQIQRTPLTDGGIAFVGPNQGIFLTQDGNSFQDISTQIEQNFWGEGATSAPIGYSNNMLFVAAGAGLIWDERTKAWHNSTAIVTNTTHAAADRKSSEIMVSTKNGATMTMWTYKADLSNLAGSWTWKSVPLRSEDGRQIAIREVQVYVETFDSNSTLAVTVGDTTHSITITSASKQHLSYRFLDRGEILDIKLVGSAGTPADNQGPSVEVIRIGYTTGHLLLQ